MADRFLVIHGHFYQPPRENPWLEAVELQSSSYPYHDWNERVTVECYAPNAASRILDAQDQIVEIVNNYRKMSFNVGPTLFSWMEVNAPDVYQAILQADQESQKLFSGHGSAMAQVYNHLILPLANRRDKVTQVRWGIREFEHRFGRQPEGMWLPETAVDLESLEVMAQQGIRFTVLAAHQAPGLTDTSRPYLQKLSSGNQIALFFYHGAISQGIAFEGLLISGDRFAEKLLSAFPDRADATLVSVATDGETYGHHHRFGEMALSYAIRKIESDPTVSITNFAQHLAEHPPTDPIQILENSSWSCVHGVERWRSPCGCHSGLHPTWNQTWRAPLRESLNWLRDQLALLYEKEGKAFFPDPWAARDAYIDVVLNRSLENREAFLKAQVSRPLEEKEQITVWKLLELQRHAMLMFTSCGWFFDDLSRIETVQVIQYAGRAIQLAQEVSGQDLEPGFLKILEKAKSNLFQHGNGRQVYEKYVKRSMVDLEKVGAHYAVSSLFENYPEETVIYCYEIRRKQAELLETGKAKLLVGQAQVTSQITRESIPVSFGVLHFGDHNMNGGVQSFSGESAYQQMADSLKGAFSQADFSEVIRLMDHHFGKSTYSLRSLFRDEQTRIINILLEGTLRQTEEAYREIYDHQAPLLRFLTGLGIPPPQAFLPAAEFVVNSNLKKAFANGDWDLAVIQGLLQRSQEENVHLDEPMLTYTFEKQVERWAESFRQNPLDLDLLERLSRAVSLRSTLPFGVNLWQVQNRYYVVFQEIYPRLLERSQSDEKAALWVERFLKLGKDLGIRVASPEPLR